MSAPWSRDRHALLLAVGLSVAFVAWAGFLSDRVADRGGWWTDDAIYRFQGKCLAIGRVWVSEPPEAAAFRVPGTTIYEGRWFGKYYPGYPILLAAGEVSNAPWIVNPILGGAAVLATFFLGAAFASAGVGLAAAALLAVSPAHALLSVSYLSHPTCMLMATGAAIAVLRAREHASRAWGAFAGFLVGWAAATRPFTFLLLAVPLAVVVIRDFSRDRRACLNWVAPFVIAVLPWFAVTLLWNAALTGSPTTSAYEVSVPRDGLGFVDTSPGGRGRYSPEEAIETTRKQLRAAADTIFPIPLRGPFAVLLALPLLAPIVLSNAHGRGAMLVGLVTILVAGHFFYPGTRGASATGLGPRYYIEGIPFYFVSLGLVVGAALTRARAPRRVVWTIALVTFGAAAFASARSTFARVRVRHDGALTNQNHRLEAWLGELEPGRRLIFVDISTYNEDSAVLANRPDLANENLVAVYRVPELNRAVIDAFPEREAYILRWDRQIASADMRRYVPEEDVTGPPHVFPYTMKRFAREMTGATPGVSDP